MDETKLIAGLSKDIDERLAKQYTEDFKKIRNYLIRQTYTESISSWECSRKMSFDEFLVGMLHGNKTYEELTVKDKKFAKRRYIHALSSSIKGNAEI